MPSVTLATILAAALASAATASTTYHANFFALPGSHVVCIYVPANLAITCNNDHRMQGWLMAIRQSHYEPGYVEKHYPAGTPTNVQRIVTDLSIPTLKPGARWISTQPRGMTCAASKAGSVATVLCTSPAGKLLVSPTAVTFSKS